MKRRFRIKVCITSMEVRQSQLVRDATRLMTIDADDEPSAIIRALRVVAEDIQDEEQD